MKAKKHKKKYREKLTIREIPRSTISAEDRLNTIADIIIERLLEVSKAKGLPAPVNMNVEEASYE